MSAICRWKLSVAVTFSACLLLNLTGCDDGSQQQLNPQVEVISYADETVKLMIPENMADRTRWDPMLEEWEAQTEGKTQIVTYRETGELLQSLQDDENRTNAIVFFPRQEFSAVGSAGVLDRIPESLLEVEDFNWRDIYESLRKSALHWNGKPTVLPVREPVLLVYYRRDLLEAADLEPPRHWEDYRNLLATIDEWAPGLSAVEPWSPDFRTFMYLTHALPYVSTPGNYSVFFDYSSGTPLIDTPGFVRGIEQSREVLTQLDPRATQMSPEDCLEAIRTGTAAIAIAPAFPSSDASRLEAGDGRQRDFPVAVVPIPGATSIYDPGRDTWRDLGNQVNRAALSGWEGLFVGVAENQERDNQAAWNLLRSLMMGCGRDCFSPGVMTSNRLSTSEQYPWSPEFARLDEASHVDAVRETFGEQQLVPALMILHRDEFLAELTETVNQLIVEDSEADASAGLQALAEKWSALMEQHGADETRLSYARTLGFSVNR